MYMDVYVVTEHLIRSNTVRRYFNPVLTALWFIISLILGGTVDITIHEVVDHEKLKELNYASGGAWGGTCVDKAFEMFLRKIVGMFYSEWLTR